MSASFIQESQESETRPGRSRLKTMLVAEGGGQDILSSPLCPHFFPVGLEAGGTFFRTYPSLPCPRGLGDLGLPPQLPLSPSPAVVKSLDLPWLHATLVWLNSLSRECRVVDSWVWGEQAATRCWPGPCHRARTVAPSNWERLVQLLDVSSRLGQG